MKKYFFLFAMCIALFSCQKEENTVVDPLQKYYGASDNLPRPEQAGSAMVIAVQNPPVKLLENIELTESGMFVAYETDAMTKAVVLSGVTIYSGKYTKEGQYYVLTLKDLRIKIPVVTDASELSSILVDTDGDGIYEPSVANAKSIVDGAKTAAVSLCRTWYPTGFAVAVTLDGTVLYNKEFAKFMDLQRDFLKYALGREVTDADLFLDAELENLIFTNNHTAVVAMSGDKCKLCQWTEEASGDIRFSINGLSVTARPCFTAGKPNLMNIVVTPDSDINANDIKTKYGDKLEEVEAVLKVLGLSIDEELDGKKANFNIVLKMKDAE